MQPISKQGYEKLNQKISKIKEEYEKMPEIIAHAREKGDLKENAEYHAARERQGLLKAEMDKLGGDLGNCQVIDPEKLPKDVVTFGKKITVKNLNNQNSETYTLVGPAETDSEKNFISIMSLLAKGFLGKKKGDKITLSLPAGEKTYEILSIEPGQFS